MQRFNELNCRGQVRADNAHLALGRRIEKTRKPSQIELIVKEAKQRPRYVADHIKSMLPHERKEVMISIFSTCPDTGNLLREYIAILT